MASAGAKISCGANSGTVANRPRTTVAEPMLAHRKQFRKCSFYHLLKQRRT